MRFWLANSEHPWLLIIDNADDPDVDYSCYLPTGSRSAVILTSRSPDCLDYGNVGAEELTGLANEDAVQLLLRSCGLPQAVWPENMASAQIVVDRLSRHTLAITQAGAFIRKRFCSLLEYPNAFQNQRQRLLEFYPKQAQSTYRHVYATFDVSLTYLTNSSLGMNRSALQLPDILGFMHNDQISESMFVRAATHLRKVETSQRDGRDFAELYSWHVDRFPSDIMPKTPSNNGFDMFAFREARAILASLSLIRVGVEDGEMSMHPLIHAWIRDRMQSTGGHEIYRTAWE